MPHEPDSPTVNKRALLAELLRKKATQPRTAALSFAQQRLWFLDQLEPGTASYNISRGVRVSGPLDRDALQAALDAIVARHEALRTNFVSAAGSPLQLISPESKIRIESVDLSGLPRSERVIEAQRLASSAARVGFDLSSDGLLRATLFRLDEEDHVFLLVMHHIISDGWSMGIIFRELGLCYEAFARGQSSPLALLPIQYSDFASWQRKYLQGEVLREHFDYWREQLQGAPALLELPTDRPRAAIQSFAGSYHQEFVPGELKEELHELSRGEGVTLFMTLLAAFQTLLQRYTQQDDIVVGTPIANRTRAETENLVGLFVNTLVMRSKLGDNPTFRELVRRVRSLALDAYAHQDLPFEKLVEELVPERSLSRMPVFQILFALQNVPKAQLDLPGLETSEFSFDKKFSKLDLSLYVGERAGGLTLTFEYNTDLFDVETIEQLAGQYSTLLREIVQNPDQPISELEVLTSADRQRILIDWNSAPAEVSIGEPVHRVFEQQAESTPDAGALVFQGQSLTYSELNRRANQLARHLQAHGVLPHSRVGILLPRSLEMVVGMLAVLKAGAAYVPLDPDYPAERLAFMVRDADLEVIVSLQELSYSVKDALNKSGSTSHEWGGVGGGDQTLRVFPPLTPPHSWGGELNQSFLKSAALPVICVDAEKHEIELKSDDNLAADISPDLAYMIYTSGSTGQPKGVMVTHQSVTHLFANTRSRLGLSEREVWSVVHSSAFDFSVWEIWGCLLQGGRLVIVPREVAQSPAELFALLKREGVTVLNQTPSSLRQLLEARAKHLQDSSAGPSDWQLKLIACGGDALDQDLAQELAELEIPAWNFYGPTENAVWTTLGLIGSVAESDSSQSNTGLTSIGRPIQGLDLYVLDRFLQPVPVGCIGELLIGGPQLARGYFQRPGHTAERFIPHPFSASPGERLYRTGDHVRYRRDGSLEFLGRGDHQVKLRGFRIELGEIEAVLSRHAQVRQAVVLLREDRAGDQRLIAYVVTDDDGKEPSGVRNPGPAELRSFLQQWLPDYMTPASFVMLDALPLTSNGKVDRLALAGSTVVPEPGSSLSLAPQTPTEEIVANIWSAVLGIERVNAADNFFLLGGHSLLATQVISRLRSVFQFELPLRLLFQHPTVAALAGQIDEAARTGQQVVLPPLVAKPRKAEVPASFAQQRLWFLDQLQPGGSAYNIARAVRLQGPLQILELNQALNELIARHESLRTSFGSVDGSPLQIISPGETIDLELIDLSQITLEQAEEQARVMAAKASHHPFDISRGPLLRATLFRLNAHDHILLLATHHIVGDGWSMGILFRELGAFYGAQKRQQPPDLSPLPIQYADFALWQRAWLEGETLQNELAYWRAQLDGAPARLELPADRPRPRLQAYEGSFVSRRLPEELSGQLIALARDEGSTLFMTLLAAFQTLLLQYTGQEDLVVGTPIANRTNKETEGLIGYFANTLVLRTNAANNPTFQELLRRVRETALEAYSHQDLPFERIVEELQLARNLSHNPLVQVLFALQNVPRSRFEMDELTTSDFSFDRKTSTLDLSLYVRETAEGLATWFEYNTSLFDVTTIERMAVHFEALLRRIVADPRQHVRELPLLTDDERQQILEWNSTKAPHFKDALVHQLFEKHALERPDAVAVVFEEQRISYAELNRRANRWANHLRRRGVWLDEAVALFVDRSIEMVVGMLAILKAGGAYLPIDVSYPQERVSFMLANAGVRLVLSKTALVDELHGAGVETLSLDDSDLVANESDENPISLAKVENLAYVIYTSGSTGQPKGVAVEHASVVHLFNSTSHIFNFGKDDVWTNAHSFAFDFSVWEIFGALLSGGRLVIVPRDKVQAPAEFLDLISRESVSMLGLTPSALRQLADARRESSQTELSLRIVTCGGEALPAELIDRLLEWQIPVWNFFGPTEATVWVSVKEVEPSDSRYKFAPIGGPFENTEMYVLDENLQLAPVGIPGELYLGGDGLARGYFNNPTLTAERFVPHPFGDEPGKRLYRTGDVARYLQNGTLEFIGRSDYQVKVRGFRIELTEIEASISKYPGVRQAVVVAREEHQQNVLIAYVVPGEISPTVTELRNFLKQKLPEYMVPSHFVMLEALPLNASGKIDRLKLPAPDLTRPQLDSGFVAPRSQVETDLANIWRAVLRREGIGVMDNFFELGGHSLLATQLLSRVRSQFNIELPLRQLFESPTIAGLAVALSNAPEMQSSPMPRIRRKETRSKNALLTKVSELTSEEVDAMLAEVLTGDKGR